MVLICNSLQGTSALEFGIWRSIRNSLGASAVGHFRLSGDPGFLFCLGLSDGCLDADVGEAELD